MKKIYILVLLSVLVLTGILFRYFSGVTEVTILVPNDIDGYKKAMVEYVQVGGKNPLDTELFVKKTIHVSRTRDVIQASAEQAALQIPSQGGIQGAQVVYLKVVGGVAYVLLGMDMDGWAGVSVSIAMIHPIVEKTLLQFPEIKSVKFSRWNE